MNKHSFEGSKGRLLDCVGVGFGPSNIALAIALEEQGLLGNTVFIESAAEITWHPGMMIPGTDIQHNPLRDLVTPRNPASKYGFLSYLQEKARLFEYLNLSAHYPPRSEYAGYVKWVGNQFLNNVLLSTEVLTVEYEDFAGHGVCFRIQLSDGRTLRSKSVSFGPGRSYNIPSVFKKADKRRVVHLTDYLFAKKRWLSEKSDLQILVVGGSQSAAEIALDLLGSASVANVTCVSRGFGFKQKDLSAFTEEIYFPDFTDYFHALGVDAQNSVTRELWRSNYGAADPDVIEALNLFLYEQSVTGGDRLSIYNNLLIQDVVCPPDGSKIEILAREKNNSLPTKISADAVILATGFLNFGEGDGQEPIHPTLHGISHAAQYRSDGGISIDRDYRLSTKPELALPPLFINGLCETTHGFGDAGSFSLLSVRSDTIACAIGQHLAMRSELLHFEES